MRETRLTMPEVAAIAGTRVALGGGLALLVADRMERRQRTALGWGLFLLGAVTTVPLVMRVLDKRE